MDFVQDIVKECTVSLYDSAWKTGEGLLSSEQTRSSFLQLSLVGQILPANSIAKLMQSFLGGHKTRGRQLSDTTLRLLLCFIGCSYRSDDRNANYGSDVLKEMFQMWWSLSSNNKEAGSSFRRQTMAHVGFMLTQVLNKDDIESAMFVALMNEKPVGAFLDRCIGFRTKEAFEEDPILSFDQDSGFLKSILWCDFSRFAPSLLAKFRQKPQHVSTAWENGLLDPAALVLLRRSSELPGEAESYKELADMILSRIVFVFSNMVSTPQSKI